MCDQLCCNLICLRLIYIIEMKMVILISLVSEGDYPHEYFTCFEFYKQLSMLHCFLFFFFLLKQNSSFVTSSLCIKQWCFY